MTDEYGVLHRVSRVSDPGTINLLTTAMEDKKLIIADGHHRYETALKYSREHAPASPASSERNSHAMPQPPYPEAAVMMTFVNMDSEGLVILPTHRVVLGLEDFSPEKLLPSRADFDVERLGDLESAEILQRLRQGHQGDSLRRRHPDRRSAAALKTDASAESAASLSPDASASSTSPVCTPWCSRGCSALPRKRSANSATSVTCATRARAMEQVAEGEANVVFLINPVTLDQLREMAFAGDVMPQKSTDFYPKLLSGLAIYALD